MKKLAKKLLKVEAYMKELNVERLQKLELQVKKLEKNGEESPVGQKGAYITI